MAVFTISLSMKNMLLLSVHYRILLTITTHNTIMRYIVMVYMNFWGLVQGSKFTSTRLAKGTQFSGWNIEQEEYQPS